MLSDRQQIQTAVLGSPDSEVPLLLPLEATYRRGLNLAHPLDVDDEHPATSCTRRRHREETAHPEREGRRPAKRVHLQHVVGARLERRLTVRRPLSRVSMASSVRNPGQLRRFGAAAATSLRASRRHLKSGSLTAYQI